MRNEHKIMKIDTSRLYENMNTESDVLTIKYSTTRKENVDT